MDPGERSRTFALGLEELRRLAFDPFILERWLGARVDDRPFGTVRVTDAAGTAWPGFVHIPSSSGALNVCLGSPEPDRGLAQADFRVSVSSDEAGRSRVRVTTDDSSDCRLDLLWEPALSRLEALVTSELSRRETPTQAIVIIHGIGEQRPGQTLEAFVRAVTREATGQQWSSQDRFAPTLELRRLTLSQEAARPRTTFYEYYWAHEVNDTSIGDVVSWVWSIMGRFRRPFRAGCWRPGSFSGVWLLRECRPSFRSAPPSSPWRSFLGLPLRFSGSWPHKWSGSSVTRLAT